MLSNGPLQTSFCSTLNGQRIEIRYFSVMLFRFKISQHFGKTHLHNQIFRWVSISICIWLIYRNQHPPPIQPIVTSSWIYVKKSKFNPEAISAPIYLSVFTLAMFSKSRSWPVSVNSVTFVFFDFMQMTQHRDGSYWKDAKGRQFSFLPPSANQIF